MCKKLKYIVVLCLNLTFVLPLAAQTKITDTTTYNKKPVIAVTNVKLPVITAQNILPQNYYTKNLPFFCRKELQVEKATKIAIKFRLGSVADCNKLEGKQ